MDPSFCRPTLQTTSEARLYRYLTVREWSSVVASKTGEDGGLHCIPDIANSAMDFFDLNQGKAGETSRIEVRPKRFLKNFEVELSTLTVAARS